MMPYLLWFLGLLFIFIEFYVPGMIMGTIGGIMLVISVVLFIIDSASIIAGFFYLLAVLISLFFLIKYTLKYIPKAKSSFSIYSNKDQEGFYASTYDKSVIGKKGTVIADLKPGGYILVEGKKHQAISVSGYIPQGTEVDVIGGEAESLIVK